MATKIEANRIRGVLKDAGMKPDRIEKITSYLEQDHQDKVMAALQEYRCKIVTEIHTAQDHLYYLDFLFREISQEKSK